MENNFTAFTEFAKNCDFENREEAIIREIFITNMLDDDIQQDFFRDTVHPDTALSIAVNMEMGLQNQDRSHQTTTTTTKTAQLAVQSMLYNLSIDFAARILAEIN